jgi:hypothetical protein
MSLKTIIKDHFEAAASQIIRASGNNTGLRSMLNIVGKLLRSVQQRRERYEFEGEVVDQVAEVMSVVIRLRETCGRHGLVGKLGSIGYCLM